MKMHWLVPGSQSCAAHRIPRLLLLRIALDEPKFLLYWYLTLCLIIVPLFFSTTLLARHFTWLSVLVVNSLVAWFCVCKLATLALYPGSSKMYSRHTEMQVACEIQNHVNVIVADLMAHLCGDKLELESFTLHALLHQFPQLAASFARLEHIDAQAQEFVFAFCALPDRFAKWNQSRHHHTGKEELIATCKTVLSLTKLLTNLTAPVIAIDSDDEEEEDAAKIPLPPQRNVYKLAWELASEQFGKFIQAKRAFPGLLDFAWGRIHLETSQQGKCMFIRHIECVQFPPHSANNAHKQVMVLCNPNAVRFEVYAMFPSWIDFYRKLGLHVVVWNYRGFGRSRGSPSPAAAREDVEMIVDYLHEAGFAQIAFHGESIGGIPACFAASRDSQHLLVADRTFASLESIVQQTVGVRLAKALYYLTMGWEADNVANFLHLASVKNRLILQDANDGVVRHAASLKVGVARKLANNNIPLNDAAALCTLVGTLFQKQHGQVDHVLCKRVLRLVLYMDAASGEMFKSAFELDMRAITAASKKQPFAFSAICDWFACVNVFGDMQAVDSVLAEVDVLLAANGSDADVEDLRKLAHLLGKMRQCSAAGNAPLLLRGTLLSLTCGHSGMPPKKDKDRIIDFLSKAGWLQPEV